MKLFDEFGNDVTDQYVSVADVESYKHCICELESKVATLSKKKKV